MEEQTNAKSSGTVSRRDFVKGTAAVVGSLMASQFPLSASAFYGADDTIKVGLIGRSYPDRFFSPVKAEDWQAWQLKLSALGDPYLDLKRLTIDDIEPDS